MIAKNENGGRQLEEMSKLPPNTANCNGRLIRAVGNKILVRRLRTVTESKGGIIIPGKYQQQTLEGVVLAVGPGEVSKKNIRRPIDLSPGDHVFFVKNRGANVGFGGWDSVVLEEGDILGAFAKS